MGEGGKKRKGLSKTCKDVGREEETGAEENYQSWVRAKNEFINLRLVDNEDETWKNVGREDEVVCIHQS